MPAYCPIAIKYEDCPRFPPLFFPANEPIEIHSDERLSPAEFPIEILFEPDPLPESPKPIEIEFSSAFWPTLFPTITVGVEVTVDKFAIWT